MDCVRSDREAETEASRLMEWYQETGKGMLLRVLLSLYEMLRLAYLIQGWAAHRGGSDCPHFPFPLLARMQEDVCALPLQSYPKAAVISPRLGHYSPKSQDHGLRRRGNQIWSMRLRRNWRMAQLGCPPFSRVFSTASWYRLRSGLRP